MKRMKGKQSFLTRLGRDTRGNTIALVAAATLPLAGMIGGAVDMSRLYLTKTRLQQACDAGALAGRRVMATGAWTTGNDNGSAEDRAKKLFAANFVTGAYGTGTLTKTFTESEGTVTGRASVIVPMTIMRIFGITQRSLSVNCTAKMEIPNTDVMFVLDVTYSMAGSRIVGLKSAVKCFYEALVKVGTPEVCDGGTGATDPTAASYTGTAQIRLGFVPYAVNANVGYLLPTDYMADNWTYQSRVANTSKVNAWTVGPEKTVSNWGGWNGYASTSNFNINSPSSQSSNITLADGKTYLAQNTSATNKASCEALNSYGGSGTLVGITETVGSPQTATYTPTNNNPPVHPAGKQDLEAKRVRTNTLTRGYLYAWESSTCKLKYVTAKSGSSGKYDQQSTGTSSRDISWTEYQRIDNWTYKPLSFSQIKDLKKADGTWATSIILPIGQAEVKNIKLSGSNSNTTINIPQDRTVTWDGCMEEQNTFQTSNTNPVNDWEPVPADALDMDINLVPSALKAGSYWGPMLKGAVWGRYSGSGSARYFNELTTTSDLDQNKYMKYYCPTPSRKLAEYKTSGDLVSYINSFSATDLGTYHDSGMIWGARLLSPTGIFASENAMTAKGGPIQRHLIFMTDGNAQTVHDNYTSFGLSYWDRRQTSYDPSETQTNTLVNARLSALCNKIKNMNITLWVISYGGDVNAANETRLENCATPGRYYSADDAATLMARFKQIAAEIAQLRLIS